MKFGGPGLVLFLLHLVLVHTANAVTLVPLSITTCPGQTVMFNCTSYGIPITWSVFTPSINYTYLEISDANRRLMDGFIMADLIALDASTMPITVVSSLTVNVTTELEGSKVQCLGFTANGQDREIKSGFIHITVPPGPIELRAPDVSDVVFGRTTITSITISWTSLELEGVDYNTSITPTIPFQRASNTSIVIPNVPYNTQYTITVVASNCAGSSIDTISIKYSECGPPVAADGVVIHNYTTTFEGSSITFTCEHGLFPNVTITATCTGEGHWSTNPATFMCIDITIADCPIGSYLAQTSSSNTVCRLCPNYSVSTLPYSLVCECLQGYHRSPLEDIHVPCTRPPSSCRNLRVHQERTRANTITVSWERPLITGRDDYYYDIFYSDPQIPGNFKKHNLNPFIKDYPLVTYSVSGLRPLTGYTIRVVAHNGVSNQDPEGEEERRCEVSETTGNIRAQPPRSVTSFCSVIVWKAPSRAYGVITGYEVYLSLLYGNNSVIVSKDRDEFFHVVREKELPRGEEDILVMVRAKTVSHNGTWSDPISLNCPDTDDGSACPEV